MAERACIRTRESVVACASIVGALCAPLEAGLVADPISVDFGDVAIARSVDPEAGRIRCFVEVAIAIENRGPSPVEILSVTIVESADTPDRNFELRTHDCGELGPGGGCSAIVRYAPRVPGGHSAFLSVRASDGEELIVPLWGDAVEAVWEGSEFEAPTLAFPAAPAGSSRTRAIGIVNETNGDVLASAAIEGSSAFSAIPPPPMEFLPPGGELLAAVTCTYSPPPGVRTAVLTWNVPPPMLPIVRALRIPLSAEVVSCLETLRSASVPPQMAERLRGRNGRPPFALLPRPKGPVALSRRLVFPLPGRPRPGLGICGVRFAPGDTAPSFGEWTFAVPKVGDEVALALAPFFTARPIEPSGERAPLGRRLKARVLSVSRKRAILWGPDPVLGMITDIDVYDVSPPPLSASGSAVLGMMTDVDLYDCHSCFGPPAVPSALLQSRVYVVGRKEYGVCIAALSVRRQRGGEPLDSPKLGVTWGPLPSLGDKEPVAIRSLAPVAVRESDGTWTERVVVVARYGNPEDPGMEDEEVIMLLRPMNEVHNFDFKVEIEAAMPLPQDFEVAVLSAHRKRIASCDDPRPEILVLLGSRKEGRISAYGCRRDEQLGWSWRRKEEIVLGPGPLPIEEVSSIFFLGEEEYAPGDCLHNRRAFDHIGNFCAVAGRRIYIFEGTGGGYELVARKRMADAEWISVPRPKSVLAGEKPALYVLEKRKAGGCVLSALDLCVRPLRGAPGNTGKPVLLTGDCVFLARAGRGETGAQVRLEADAFDPDGSALSYSWTAPGIEFDDPTSPTPSAFFPVGETNVYLVVRDGPADSPETRESDPRLVRVVVVREPSLASCGDANGDGRLDIADAVWILIYLFADGAPPVSMDVADANGDRKVDIADPIYLLMYLFVDGPPPVCPVGA
ncbi:MAG: hypothetical protein ACUVYA_07470 [Planctomycetota bacterium]